MIQHTILLNGFITVATPIQRLANEGLSEKKASSARVPRNHLKS